MKIYGNIRREVDIEPKDVINKLIDHEIGSRNWVFQKDGKYYRGYESSAGCHFFTNEEEINKDQYEYVLALKQVLQYLTKDDK